MKFCKHSNGFICDCYASVESDPNLATVHSWYWVASYRNYRLRRLH